MVFKMPFLFFFFFSLTRSTCSQLILFFSIFYALWNDFDMFCDGYGQDFSEVYDCAYQQNITSMTGYQIYPVGQCLWFSNRVQRQREILLIGPFSFLFIFFPFYKSFYEFLSFSPCRAPFNLMLCVGNMFIDL